MHQKLDEEKLTAKRHHRKGCAWSKKFTGTCGKVLYQWSMEIIVMGRGYGRWLSGGREMFVIQVPAILFRSRCFQYTNFLTLSIKESVIISAVFSARVYGKQWKMNKPGTVKKKIFTDFEKYLLQIPFLEFQTYFLKELMVNYEKYCHRPSFYLHQVCLLSTTF